MVVLSCFKLVILILYFFVKFFFSLVVLDFFGVGLFLVCFNFMKIVVLISKMRILMIILIESDFGLNFMGLLVLFIFVLCLKVLIDN